MAESTPSMAIGADIGFKAIQLFKEQTLGIGSYGAVCKAKCDDLICAAKILHPTLFDPLAHQQAGSRVEHRLPIKRFEKECEFMSAIRHPNIVQYLCTCVDPETRLPALLMELMDQSLTRFVESCTQPIPYHILVNVCHDIASALSFLHSNNIVHRDLSSNNVLLIGNAVRAKVTDFGMARLGDLNPQATHLTFTMCPGTDVYMPPEAVRSKPAYNENVDCFSFGVIIIQMLSRQFPKPSDRLKEVRTNDPQFPSGTVEVRVPEIERRQNHISCVAQDQPLLLIALNCLKDNDNERPSASQIRDQVAALKESTEYAESNRSMQEILDQKDQQIQEAQERIQTLSEEIESNNELVRGQNEAIQSKNASIVALVLETAQIQSQLEQQVLALKEKDQTIAEKEKALETLQIEKEQLQIRLTSQQKAHDDEMSRRNEVISANEAEIADKNRQIGELRKTLSGNEEKQLQSEMEMADKDREMRQLRKLISDNEEKQVQNEKKIEDMNRQIIELRKAISDHKEKQLRNEMETADKNRQIGELRKTLSANEEKQLQNEKKIEDMNRQIRELGKGISDHEEKQLQLVKEIQQKKETIYERDIQIRKFENEQKLFAFKGRNTSPVCTYSRLLEVLTPCSHKWYGIGLHLGLSIEKLAPLMEMSVTSEQILQEVLKMKLKSGEEVTWGDVVIALVKVDETGLAQKLAGTHTHAARWVDYKVQKLTIQNALQQRLKEGDTWYLVDIRWMKQWKKYVGYNQWDQTHAGREEANPGPVDNSSLFRGNFGAVRYHLMEELDYSLLPQTAWGLVILWYGLSENSKPIARKVVEHGIYMKHCKVEVYLLEFRLSLYPNTESTKTRLFSRADTVGDLEAALREEFQVEKAAECQVWYQFMPHAYELIHDSTQTLQDADLHSGQTIILVKRNKDGSWPTLSKAKKLQVWPTLRTTKFRGL